MLGLLRPRKMGRDIRPLRDYTALYLGGILGSSKPTPAVLHAVGFPSVTGNSQPGSVFDYDRSMRKGGGLNRPVFFFSTATAAGSFRLATVASARWALTFGALLVGEAMHRSRQETTPSSAEEGYACCRRGLLLPTAAPAAQGRCG